MTDATATSVALASLVLALTASPSEGNSPERFAGETRLRATILSRIAPAELPQLLLDEAQPVGRHGRFVTTTALEWGVPPEALTVAPLATAGPNRWAVIAQAHSGAATLERWDVEQLLATDAIIVAAAGNPDEGNAQGADSAARYLTPSHAHWSGPQGRSWWRRAITLMERGHLIVARASIPDEDGWQHDTSIHCGATAQWCYTVPARPKGLGEGSTSKAATLLASLLTFLNAFAREPLTLLNACAIDIGTPGIDPVFGRGLVTADCPEITEALALHER